MLNYDNTINSKELTYEPYHQSRGDGFSGKLFLATEINNPEKKYIIKSMEAHVTACEYMFYKLASKLGFNVARVRLVTPSKFDDFKYPACAVDFIPNAVKLKYDEYKKIEECNMLLSLSFILGDRDNMDFLKDENGMIYKIDHSDCFGIEETAETWVNPEKNTIGNMFYQISKPKPNIGHYAEKDELRSMFENISHLSMDDFNEDLSLINEYCGTDFEMHFRYYINELIEQCKTICFE